MPLYILDYSLAMEDHDAVCLMEFKWFFSFLDFVCSQKNTWMFLSFESTLVSTFSWGLCAEFCALLIALSPAVLLQVSEVYLEPSQTSTMELFCENS